MYIMTYLFKLIDVSNKSKQNITIRWPQKACQVPFRLQDFDENFARKSEGGSRRIDCQEHYDPGPLRNPWTMHMGTTISVNFYYT